MDIGIIGAGNIGGNLARLLADAGHRVMVSNSRSPETLADLVAEIGGGASAGTAGEAAGFGEVVIESVPYGRLDSLPASDLAGKVLVTTANLYPQRDGRIDLGGMTESARLAAMLPRTRVVKAFNTIWFEHLKTQGNTGLPVDDRRAIFVAGDDAAAKATVSGLIEQIGFGAVDTGSLANSAVQQPGAAVYNQEMTTAEGRRAVAAAAH